MEITTERLFIVICISLLLIISMLNLFISDCASKVALGILLLLLLSLLTLSSYVNMLFYLSNRLSLFFSISIYNFSLN